MSVRFVLQASAVYVAVALVEICASLIALPVMTRHLSPRDYGAMLLIANGAALINLLFGYSLAQALPAMFASAPDDGSKSRAVTTILVAILAVSVPVHTTVALFAWPISEAILGTSDYATAVRLGVLASFVTSTSLCLVSVVRMREFHGTYLRIQLPSVVLQLAMLLVLLVVFGMGLWSPYLAMATAGLWSMCAYAWVVRRDLSGTFDRAVLRQAVGVAASIMPWQLATLLTTNCAGFFFARSGRLHEAGMFAVAASVSMPLVAISNGFASVWTPFVLNRQSDEGLVSTQKRMFGLYSAMLLVLASGLALFSREIFFVLTGPSFQPAYVFVAPLALALSLFCFANNFAQGLQARRQTSHYAWIGTLTGVVFLALALTLAGPFGAYGIIGAMAGGFGTMLVCLQVVSQRVMPVPYPWVRHGAMWFAAVGLVASCHRLELSWPTVFVKAGVLAAVVILTRLFGAIDARDLRAARDLITSLRRA